ncbi:tRNA (uridine(54)-C5)-methyltransferase TrmA [Kistimonas scapharcae]|uniref:tRNA/tmRNA (uracil-C(5))-methyltransferase n=1 Tax=Kistimonas scapharcae TaxID=1036133 RepID=A0ABP8UZI0_9GAMM
MSTDTVQPERYDDLLREKADRIEAMFAPFAPPALEVFRSSPSHYRMRTEFHIWHQDDRAHYAMFAPGNKSEPFFLTDFPVASERINSLMQPLLDALCEQEILRRKLFQIEFLTTQTGEALVSLIYHKKLDEQWLEAVRPLREQFNIHIIGRARKQKLVLDQDFVTETLTVNDKQWRYQQVENSFTQPNAGINEKMLGWAANIAKDSTGDLLELYCGNANFTCVLSEQFRRVLATEISKSSVKSAHHNFALNGVDNADIVRMSSEEFTQAMNKERPFRRLQNIDLDSYDFSTVLVDPPRAGLDKGTEALVQRFERIIYISCNPETLQANLDTLSQTHRIERFALFDQFPYTHHAECGVYLVRK